LLVFERNNIESFRKEKREKRKRERERDSRALNAAAFFL